MKKLLSILAIMAVGFAHADAYTYITLESEEGDSVGAGETVTLTDDFAFEVNNGALSITHPSGFNFMFTPPADGGTLKSSMIYITDIKDAAFNVANENLYLTANSGINVSSTSLQCEATTGDFILLDYDADYQVLAINFKQYCDGSSAKLEGEIRLNSGVSKDFDYSYVISDLDYSYSSSDLGSATSNGCDRAIALSENHSLVSDVLAETNTTEQLPCGEDSTNDGSSDVWVQAGSVNDVDSSSRPTDAVIVSTTRPTYSDADDEAEVGHVMYTSVEQDGSSVGAAGTYVSITSDDQDTTSNTSSGGGGGGSMHYSLLLLLLLSMSKRLISRAKLR